MGTASWARTTLTWLGLVCITFGSWAIGHHAGPGGTEASGVAVLLIAFVKVRIVAREFMEVRSAPRWLRAASDGWILLLTTVLVVRFVV